MFSKNKGKELWANKDFMLLFFGGFVSRIGNNIYYIALTWFVLELTGSGTATGIIMFLSTLPWVIFGSFGGVVADRANRKFLIVGMDFIRGIIMIWLSWVVYTGAVQFIHLAVATILVSISSTFFTPAVEATLPNLVVDGNLEQANSFQHFSQNFTAIIGAAIGGVLISVVGAEGVFMINSITYFVSGLSELLIQIPTINQEAADKHTITTDLKLGVDYFYQHKAILSLFVVLIFVNFLFAGIFTVGLPYIFKEVLEVSSKFFGIAQAVIPAGAVLGSIILNFRERITNYYRHLLLVFGSESILLFGLGLPLLPIVKSKFSFLIIYSVLLLFLLVIGLVNAFLTIPFKSLLHRMIPDDLRGRLFGLLGTVEQALVPISMALFGFLFDRLLAGLVVMSVGGVSLILTGVITKVSSLKHLGQKANKGKEIKNKNEPRVSSEY